jgi:hypothetical protein
MQYCLSISTLVTRTRHSVTLYVHCLSYLSVTNPETCFSWRSFRWGLTNESYRKLKTEGRIYFKISWRMGHNYSRVPVEIPICFFFTFIMKSSIRHVGRLAVKWTCLHLSIYFFENKKPYWEFYFILFRSENIHKGTRYQVALLIHPIYLFITQFKASSWFANREITYFEWTQRFIGVYTYNPQLDPIWNQFYFCPNFISLFCNFRFKIILSFTRSVPLVFYP